MSHLHIQPNSAELIEEVYAFIKQLADQAISERGRFLWALSGGSTPKQLFSLMAQEGHQETFPWEHTDVYWGDERDVLPTHPDSNFGAADTLLLKRLDPRPHSVNRWLTEYRPPMALADYRTKLQPAVEDGFPRLDLVLLGLGPEGHTASLFPNSPALGSADFVEHVYVAEHQSWRYTLTLPVINHARVVVFLVSGKTKANIVGEIRTTVPTPALPASMVEDRDGLHWFLDQEAASQTGP